MAAPVQLSRLNNYVRRRPVLSEELADGEIEKTCNTDGPNRSIAIISRSTHGEVQKGSSGAFDKMFEAADRNKAVFQDIVEPTLPSVLGGATCNIFAYGHSGSGKTHTIIGHDDEEKAKIGLCLGVAQSSFQALGERLEQKKASHTSKNELARYGIGLRLFELRRNRAYDLLNNLTECHVRQGPDGKTHIRGATETLENGKVRVRPIVTRPCWTYDELRRNLREGLDLRAVGTSGMHDQSSRTHAIVELEIVTKELFEARDALIDAESELVPIGKRATDVFLEERSKSLIRDAPVNQYRIDAAEAEKAEYETRVTVAKKRIEEILASSNQIGGKYVLVDLAGAEYQNESASTVVGARLKGRKQTPQERQECRQINLDLLGLKEVIRAFTQNREHIPFRSSPLTMVLREHFLRATNGTSSIIIMLEK